MTQTQKWYILKTFAHFCWPNYSHTSLQGSSCVQRKNEHIVCTVSNFLLQVRINSLFFFIRVWIIWKTSMSSIYDKLFFLKRQNMSLSICLFFLITISKSLKIEVRKLCAKSWFPVFVNKVLMDHSHSTCLHIVCDCF